MSLDHRKTVNARLAQAARAWRSSIGSRLAKVGLHAGQETVLTALGQEDGQTMSQLATVLAVQPPTVTKMVGRLAAQGHVERRASETDARQTQVFLTEQGHAALEAIGDALRRVERRALSGINDKDRRKLRRLLRQVERNLGADREAMAAGELAAE